MRAFASESSYVQAQMCYLLKDEITCNQQTIKTSIWCSSQVFPRMTDEHVVVQTDSNLRGLLRCLDYW